VHGCELPGEEAVAGHGKEDAGLAVEEDQHDRGDAEHGPDRDQPRPPGDTDVLQGEGHRGRGVEHGVRDNPGENCRDDDVEGGADDERPQDPDREVPLGSLHLLRCGGDRVKADVGKEDDGRPGDHPAPPEGEERVPVGGVYAPDAECDEDKHHGDLNRHDNGVDPGAPLDPRDEQDGNEGDDQECREVEDPTVDARRV